MKFEYLIFGLIAFLSRAAHGGVTEVFAEVGSQVVLPCKCASSHYSPEIIWTKTNKGTVWRREKGGLQYWGSRPTKGSQRMRCPHSLFDRGEYSLQISNVMVNDAGLYTCRVGRSCQAAKNVVMLRILQVSISPSPATLDSYVSITCNVVPWPQGATVAWTLNNKSHKPQNGINSEVTSRNLMEKATESLRGNWTCSVGYSNKEGRASATLDVKGIIHPSENNRKVYAAVGSASTLPCVFSPGVIPSNTVWEKLKPGSLFKPVPGRLPASFSFSSPSTSDQSATIKEVRLEDEGRYRCSATVEGQRLSRTMQLVVAKIENRIQSKKRGSITLTCDVSDTSEVTDYEWIHVTYDLNGTQSVGSIRKGNILNIDHVSEENRGEWTCRFHGKDGVLGNVTYNVQMMSGVIGEKSSSLSKNDAAALVGLSFLLIILLLVLVKMYKNYQRRKKIFQYPALETIVHTTFNEREGRERNREKK
ncbi:uncharacterized protein V6R79_011708 [Siganus canaliculatus]